MSTPFRKDGSLDEAAAERMVDRLATNGVGIFVLGTTGETASIPACQRERLVTAAVRTAAGRVPVFAGIGDNCIADLLSAAATFHKIGVSAVVAHMPSYYMLEPAEMQAYFELLATKVASPILLYNIPQTTRMSLPIDVAERLSENPRIVGLKDSENVPGRAEELARRFAGRTEFALYMGVAALSAKALRLGFQGLVPSSGNLAPALWRQLYEAAVKGDWAAVDNLQARVDAVARVFQQNRSLAQSLAALKAALASLRLCEPLVLPPLQTLKPDECQHVAKELSELQLS